MFNKSTSDALNASIKFYSYIHEHINITGNIILPKPLEPEPIPPQVDSPLKKKNLGVVMIIVIILWLLLFLSV